MDKPWWQYGLEAIPFVGPIVGGAIDSGRNKRAIERQNEYNHPKNQVQRIREAGLPYAALTGSTSGNQSQVQEIAPSGIREGIQDYVSTTMNRKQIELIQAQTEAAQAQARKTDVEANTAAYDLQLRQTDPTTTDPVSYGARMAQFEYEIKKANSIISQNQEYISTIDKNIKKELYEDGTLSTITRKQLEALIGAITRQNQEINKARVMDTVIEYVKKDGIKLHEALILAITTGQIGTGSVHFPTINTGDKNYHFNKD